MNINRLLRYEFRRLRRSTSYWVLTFVNIVLVFLTALATKLLQEMTKNSSEPMGGSTGVAQMLSVTSGLTFLIIVAIFMALFITDDYSSGAIKNIIARGYSRTQILLGKYISSLFAVFLMTALSMGIGFLTGTIFWKAGDFNGDVAKALLGQLVVMFAFHAFYFCVSNSMAKNAIAIAVNIVGPTLISVITALLDTALNIKTHTISSFWLSNLGGSLSNLTISTGDYFLYLGVAIGYIVVCMFLSVFFAKKKEF